jgi:hypothetical protein
MKALRTKVMLESPFANSNIASNKEHIIYAKRCMLHSILQGEAPFAGHLLYTRMLDDSNVEQRNVGFDCNESWMICASTIVVYTDYGISRGMKQAMRLAKKWNIPIVKRKIGRNKDINV